MCIFVSIKYKVMPKRIVQKSDGRKKVTVTRNTRKGVVTTTRMKNKTRGYDENTGGLVTYKLKTLTPKDGGEKKIIKSKFYSNTPKGEVTKKTTYYKSGAEKKNKYSDFDEKNFKFSYDVDKYNRSGQKVKEKRYKSDINGTTYKSTKRRRDLK